MAKTKGSKVQPTKSVGTVLPTKAELERKLRDSNVTRVAEEFNTYPNQIRRLAQKYGLTLVSKSEAQKRNLDQGLVKHPTEGRKRRPDELVKISEGIAESWTDERKEEQSKHSLKFWKKMTAAEKKDRLQKANAGIRVASKEGSKLEKYLFAGLIKEGFRVNFHVEHKLGNERLHIDLLLPAKKIAIEVDGPSHFRPIWGEDSLKRNRKTDRQKSGLLLAAGFKVIRIKQEERISQKYLRDTLSELVKVLNNMPVESLIEI